MTIDPELDGPVRSFLEAGADRMPDRVFRGVMGVIPTTPRRRTWRWRFRSVAPLLGAGAAGALVAAVALGGAALLSNGGIGSPRVTPTPSPTASPTPLPASTVSPLPSGGPLDGVPVDATLGAGTYEVGGPFAFPFTIELLADTRFRGIGAGSVSFATPDGSLEVFVPKAVFPDPCRVAGSPTPIGTADELVAALSSMVGFTATAPTATTVAGYPARSFVLTNTVDTATAGCTRDLMLPMFTFVGDTAGAGTNGGQRQVVWVIDVGGQPLLVLGDGWQDISRSTLQDLVGTIALRQST